MSRDSETGDALGLARRTFLGATAAAGAAAAVPSVGAAATAPRAKVDDRLDLSGGLQEAIVVFDRNEHVVQLDRFDLTDGFYRFEALPIGYTVATGAQLERIASLDTVRWVEPNAELEFHNADAREVTEAGAVQAAGNEGSKAHVAVVDSGLSALHPDHQQNVQHNYKYQNPLQRDTAWVDVGQADTDDNGHGTHTSGTVAGDGSFSGTAVETDDQRGMAPEARLTVYSTGVTLAVLNTIAAFDHLLANHTPETAATPEEVVHVTNNSYGLTGGNDVDFDPDSAMALATYATYEAGMLHCFSAGNSGPTTNTYSNYAKAPWVVGVAATDDSRNLAGFSSRGRPPEYDGADETYATNYDRDLALSNVEGHYAAQGGEPTAEASVQTESFSGGPIAGGAVVGLNQTTETFTVQSGSPSFTPDGYEVRATLTWSPASPSGPQPSDVDFTLLDANGSPVATSGSGGSETQNAAEETLTGAVTPGSDYSFEVTGWRGAATWSIDLEVFAIQTGDTKDPGRPYGVYRPDVGATGVSIVSTMSPNDPLQATDNGDDASLASPYYAAISGTSMSSPTTAGIAALVTHAYLEERESLGLSTDPNPDVVFEALEAGAEFDDGKGHTVFNIGEGFVQAQASVAAAKAAAQPESDDGGDGAENVAPTIDRFEVTEARKPDPHVDVSVDYAVSDDDGTLASLTLELFDSSGTSIETIEPSVAGASASGTADFERHRGDDGETYDVVATVTDGAGASATETKNVTEDDDRGPN